jgi:flagellar protein FlaJ
LLSVLIFFLFTKYPKTIISEKAKKLDNALPFASLYFSTIAGTKLPLHKVFRIFGKFSRYDEVKDEIDMINKDIETFGFDVNTSLERAVERTPSKSFRELIWGLLSTSISGGNISIFLREKSEELIGDYRRKLEEFSKKMMLFSEIYLTAIILGTIFFVILTSIFSGISGAGTNMILLQTLIIFVFLPLLSLGLIVLIKSATPGGE